MSGSNAAPEHHDEPSPVGDVTAAADAASATRDDPAVQRLLRAYEVPRPPRPDRPWVLCNLVATLDGRTAVYGRVGMLSTPADQLLFHHLRGLSDAILVGAATVRAERYGVPRVGPELAAARRARGQHLAPRLAIVTRSVELDGAHEMLRRADARPFVLTCESAPEARLSEIAPHVEIITAGHDTVDLARALAAVRRQGVRVVVCEGGPTLNAELLELGLVDEVCVTFAPFLGGDPLGLFERSSAALQSLHIAHALHVEGSVFIRALVDRTAL
jgi:riboflavin-specific deaminase-like protein